MTIVTKGWEAFIAASYAAHGSRIIAFLTATAQVSDRLRYRPQLDGVRALAIGIVLLAHFWPDSWPSKKFLPAGYYGVELFFVLSGFLITSILWNDRGLFVAGVARPGRLVANFYLRRFLRICPTYYLVLLYAWIAGLGVIKGSLPWFATYLTNFYIVAHGMPGSSTHLWSLAVEEQFYLLWPFVIMFLPRRILVAVLGLTIVGGGIVRGVVTLPHGEYLLPACMDYLAAGAALALVLAEAPRQMKRLVSVCAALSVTLFALGAVVRTPRLIESGVMMLSVALCGGAARGFHGVLGRLLQARALTYIGRISYGLYLFHNFIPEAILKACRFYRFGTPSAAQLMFLSVVSTFAIAAASWHFIERPLRELRKHYSTLRR